MAQVVTPDQARDMGLPGRKSLEFVSGKSGARSVTMRLVEIHVPDPNEIPRPPHAHADFEECIYVISGEGVTRADSGDYPLKAGDAILIPAGEKHVTHNTGTEPLRLLCFFPVADISTGTRELGVATR
jgi:quercetin dioxygenase-like cupin family protein